jgi:hypothetical protein
MTIGSTKRNQYDPALLDATLRYKSGLFQFAVGVTREQLEFLKTRDEEEAREICGSKSALLLPSLRGACA